MTTKPVAAASAGKKRKLVNVVLLNGDQHVVHVDVKSKFQEVFNQVAGHLSLRETEYFGLAFKKDNEYNFILLDEKIHKLAPKQWKSGNGEGVDSEGKPLITVCFRVQFYVDQVILLREKVTRHQYYLQLKDNVLQYNHLYNEEKCFQLAGYALQADHGNYLPERHETGYFNPTLYFPYWMLERHGATYLASNMPTIHKDLHNMTRNDAELRYIRNASTPPGAHNLHFYTVRKRKTDKAVNTWLAICAKGVEVYEDDAGYKNHISTFLWRDIGKLYFDKKKFEIRSIQSAGGRRFIYYTDCDIKSKYLLSICRGTHMFQMAIQPKLLEIQHLDNEDQKRYRESYVYSDSRDRSHFQHSPSKSLSATGLSSNQRFSVISDASSNTTSGIVSDRMAVSFDDGDDHSREIMIDCPPRAVLSNTPSQIKSKFQLFSAGFKQSPQSNKTSPSQIPHCLELCKSENMNPSPQELSPTSSNGSWRARHSQTPVYLIGAAGPTQTTPTNDSHSYTGLRRSGGRKDSFSKLLQGSLLSSGDRNTSGDSAVSVSGILTGPDKLAPLSLPPSEHWALAGVGASGSPSFALTPSSLQKTSGPSPPSTLNFSSLKSTKETCTTVYNKDTTEQYKIIGTQREISSQYKQLNPPPDYNEKYKSLSSPRANISEHYGNAKSFGSPRTLTEQQYKVQSTDVYKTLGSPRDVAHDVFKLPQAHRAPPEYKPTVSSPRADIYSTPTSQVFQSELHTTELLLDAQPTKDGHNPSLSQPVQVARRGATEHYLLALQQGTIQLMEQQGTIQLMEQQAKGEQKTPLNSLAQLQEHYQNISSHHQQTQEQQPPEYHLFNSKPKELLSNQPSTEASMTQEMEENKENLCNKDMEMKEKVEDSVGTQPGHNKGSLHPELKQILGQSHAISLPLITALCNDSSLMQTSRSQSGSRSSYDTSTVRSTDSRLTRLSHETDPRRWSSCCQAAGMPDMMLSVQSARPYSWHSEHFELDTQLALPATDHLTQITPPNPRAVNNKHLKILDSHNVLPQKMIESDPGPSSPRIISRYDGTSWWDTPMYTANINSSSWTEVIPYNLPAHHPPSKNSSCQHHQHMVPHKLSSGGHRDSDTSIAHKQMMKENIGIA